MGGEERRKIQKEEEREERKERKEGKNKGREEGREENFFTKEGQQINVSILGFS